MKSYLRHWLLFVITINAIIYNVNASAQDHLTLGIHPYKSPEKLIKAYTPLAKYLSREIGIPVKISISRDYKIHIENIGMNRLDIAYMGPASYIKLVDLYGQKPLLACQAINGKATFQGKIIAREDSKLVALDQLTGMRFAFGDQRSTMSHLVPRYMLWKEGVDVKKLKTYKFLGSHDNVALSVLSGDYDAGAVKEAVFYKYQGRGLKVIKSTPALSEHLFVTSSNLDPALIKKLRQAFLTLDKDSNGIKIMSSIKPGMTSMEAVDDSKYNNLREIIQTLKQIGVEI